MKKNDLLKSIGLCFIIFIILSWIIPTGSYSTGEFVKGTTTPFGITDLFYYPAVTIGTFIQYGIVFLMIGGFYGIINKTGVYQKLVDSIAKKRKGKEKTFLIITIISLALLSSLTGTPIGIFIIIPFLMAVILSMGYSKMVALVSTVGAVLVGGIGATFGLNTVGHVNKLLSLDITNALATKIILFALLVFLLIMYVLKANKITTKKENKKEELEIPLLEKVETSKKSTTPLIVLGILTFLLILIGMYNWNYILGIEFFDTAYESMMGVELVKQIFGSLSPIGYWDSYEICAVLLIASLVIGWVYSLKFEDMVKGFTEGAKKMFKVAFFVTIANIVFALLLANSDGSILMTITNFFITMTEKFNVFTTTILSVVGSFFYNNFYYFSTAVLTPMQAVFTETTMHPIMGLIVQTIHGLMMMVLPTSMILIAGLSMLDISFKEWIKYIWKFLLQILVLIIIIAVILAMIV